MKCIESISWLWVEGGRTEWGVFLLFFLWSQMRLQGSPLSEGAFQTFRLPADRSSYHHITSCLSGALWTQKAITWKGMDRNGCYFFCCGFCEFCFPPPLLPHWHMYSYHFSAASRLFILLSMFFFKTLAWVSAERTREEACMTDTSTSQSLLYPSLL